MNFSITVFVTLLVTLDLFHCHTLQTSSSASSSSSSVPEKSLDISASESLLSSSSLSSTASSPSPLLPSASSSTLTSSTSQHFPGLTFEPHDGPTNISSYIEALHSVPDHVFDNAAIIAAMDSDDFHRDLYSGTMNNGANGHGSGINRGTSATSRIGDSIYEPEEMYQEEFMPLSQFDSYNLNNQMKPHQAFGFSSSGKHHNPLMDINYNDLISSTRNNYNLNTNNNNNNNKNTNNNMRSYNGVHFISNLVPKPNGYSSNNFQPIKPTPAYNQVINNHHQQSKQINKQQQPDKNLDIDINTIRGILFQVLKHLDSQELSKNLNDAKTLTTQSHHHHHQHNNNNNQYHKNNHHQQQSTNSYLSPAKRRTTLNLYQPQPYSSSGYSSSSSSASSSSANHVNQPNTNNNYGNSNKQSSYMTHVPLAYTGKPSITSPSSSSPSSGYNTNQGRSTNKLPNHSVGYPTTVEIVGDQGLIAIPLPPNVVKFNYFGKNLNGLNKNGQPLKLNTNKKTYQSKQQQSLPQSESTGYFTSGSTNQIVKSNYHGSSNNLKGKNCHPNLSIDSSESYASSS